MSPTLTSDPTYQTPEGYGRCASVCIGNGVGDGAIAFNWINYGKSKSKCECLRKVSNISIVKYSKHLLPIIENLRFFIFDAHFINRGVSNENFEIWGPNISIYVIFQ